MTKNTSLKTAGRLLAIALALGIMIAFHEFGHYCVARAVGINVPVFSVGFGPRQYSMVLGHCAGTEFRLSPIPLGGYVEVPDLERSVFHPDQGEQLPLWKIWAVGLAGVANNLILSVVALYCAMRVKLARRSGKRLTGGKPAGTGTLIYTAAASVSLMSWMTAKEIWKLFFPYGHNQNLELAGPIATLQEGAKSMSKGSLVFCAWAATVGVGLAITNLLPVIPTDGGQIMVATVQRLLHLSDNGTAELASWSTNLAIALAVGTMARRKLAARAAA